MDSQSRLRQGRRGSRPWLLAIGALLPLGMAIAGAQGAGAPPAAPAEGPGPDLGSRIERIHGSARFGLEEFRRLRGQLAAGDFEALDASLRGWQERWEADPRSELDLLRAYAHLPLDPDLLPQLDAWVAQMPDSYSARLVRGIHYVGLAWMYRGARFASKTSEGQFAQMRRTFPAARADFAAALERNPELLVARVYQIRIHRADAGPPSPIEALKAVLARDPANYLARRELMIGIQPRWGGSHELMGRLAESSVPHLASNPLLSTLAGAVEHDRARSLRSDDDFDAALRHFGLALRAGPYAPTLRRRGETHYQLEHYDEALADLDAAIALDPFDADARVYRARVYLKRGMPQQALPDVEAAVAVDGFDSRHRKWRGWVHEKLGHAEAALRDYRRSLEMDPHQSWVKKRLRHLAESAPRV